MQLTNKTIFKITLRTYFARLFYTYKSLFGNSLFFCLIPYINSKKFVKKNSESFYKRHSSFFNANDFLIGFAIGIILHFEEKEEIDKTIKVKSVLSSTLGAIGDKLIYKTVLPVFILLQMNILLFTKFNLNNLFFTLTFLMLLIFSILNFSIRFYGIKSGFTNGISAINIFKSTKFRILERFFTYSKYVLFILLILNLIVVFFT